MEERLSDKVLGIYKGYLHYWKKALYGETTPTRLFWGGDAAPTIDRNAIKGMIDDDSDLFGDIVREMRERGTAATETRLKGDYFGGYNFLKPKLDEIDKVECRDLFLLMEVGDAFLGILEGKARLVDGGAPGSSMGTGVTHEGGGVVPTVKSNIQECQTGTGSVNGSGGELLCRGGGMSLTEGRSLQDLLPANLRRDEAIKIFQRAIDAGLIEKTATGLKWQLGNALLAYLCGIVYCGDTKQWDGYNKEYIVKRGSTLFPDKALSELFGVKNLGQSRLQLKSQPKGYEKVDVLFKG